MTQASVGDLMLHIGIEYSQILAAKGQKKWYE